MSHPSKVKGTAWETAIVRTLLAAGVPYAERRPTNGKNDRGDISGIPGVVIEAKCEHAIRLAGWLAEAETERVHAGATVGLVWHKRTGKASPLDGYITMTPAVLLHLLRAAGYIPLADA